MLPSSVRRVVVSAAPQAAALASSLGPSSAAPVLVRGHQRRCSSSKPSRPDNGPGDIPAGQSSVPASASTSARAEGKAGSDKRKRKNKDASDRSASFRKLPSVPATNHLSQEAIGLSSFFSLHRPISITQTMPRSVSDEHFASIFAAHAKANKAAETMSTLSDTIDQLEGPMAQMTIEAHHDDHHARADGMRKVEVRNPDGSESSLYLQVDAMSGDFLPYRPPPLPRPQSAADSEGMAADSEALDQGPQHRVYRAMFTIEETTEPDGQIRIVAHSPRIVNDDQPRGFLARMARRQLTFDEAQARRDMHAISVKRQRKLKMKKKKYKKLMKRTRNLRRKLDRT
ncbi:hypothetical protein HRG_010942 [Hirsutella rhossiliensis]|uniref:Small ribosomal subunit protein mS38 n=1 Tax=Hirsutella rhossiliensis TaxID=111463 RepID=A0A9P8MMQ1_9HYPO|nr:uncharacterized protein HRG_10942 [Hirsutella rhossiliensis]KAH0957849.1 hypothetical protein HRG_10942 [Hirsutella rhossiliensis]